MTVQLVVLVCACAMGMTEEPPPYMEASKSLYDLYIILRNNVLSMEGNIPLLNDPRRHYAEIFNVINYEATAQSYCQYEVEYQKNLNKSASQAIEKPQLAIDVIKELFRNIKEDTDQIAILIQRCAGDPNTCNEQVHNSVKSDPEILGAQASVLLTAGVAASKFSDSNVRFLDVSRKLAAHSYVINGAAELKDIIFTMADLHQSLNSLQEC